MKNWRRWFALLLSLALAVSLCACKSGEQADGSEQTDSSITFDPTSGTADPNLDTSPDPDAKPSIEVDLTQDLVPFAAGLSGDDILLTVNGEGVPADLFLYWLFWDCYYEDSYYYYYYGYTVDMMADRLLEDAVTLAMYRTVLRQKAAELGCLPTDAQVQEARDLLMSNGQEFYDDLKAAYGLSDESMDYIATYSYYFENLLNTIPVPTDEKLKEYMDDQGLFYVKHILLMTVDGSYEPLPDDEAAEKKTLADDLLAQLQAAEDMPAKFDELMNQYSEDGGLASNPDGYVFGDSDSLVGGFREAALELEEGQLSGIVKTDYGYHIMLRLAFTDEMRETYRTELRQGELDDLMEQWAETVEITRAPALDALDVAAFFDRYTAYQNALYEQQNGGDAVG